MRNLKLIGILAILILGFVVASGCITYNVPNPEKEIVYVTVYATPAPQSPSPNDPIIGTWRFYDSSVGFDDRYQIKADGTFKETFRAKYTGELLEFEGTWYPQGYNNYVFTGFPAGIVDNIVYDPARGTFHLTRYAAINFIRYSGSLMTA